MRRGSSARTDDAGTRVRDHRATDAYRQEYLIGEAEDIAQVDSLGNTVTVPQGTFTNCLLTEESTPMEPGIRGFKYYAPGVGLVLDVDDEGHRTELVQIIN